MHPPSATGARLLRPFRLLLLPLSAVALLGTAGCDDEKSSDEGDLQALLHDEPLGELTVGALTTDGGAGGSTGAGGSVSAMGGGGTTGVGGSFGMGGSSFGGSSFGGSFVTGRGGAPSCGSAMAGTTGVGGFVSGSGGTGFGGFMSGSGGTTGSAGVTGFGGTTGSAGTTGFGGTIATDGGFAGTSGTAGSFGMAGSGGPGGSPFTLLGQWFFDDCSDFRTNLGDSTFQQNTAFRSVHTACAEGLVGLAVSLADKDEDLVYVPDQPNFDFTTGVTVAGWFNHTSTNQTRTLFRKRDDSDSSAFALVLNGGKYQFVVNLGKKAASVTAPAKAKTNEWTHVAGTYDGATLRLYVGGVQVASKAVGGTIAPALGPFLMGNDGSKRLMAGRIDQPLLDARAQSADEIRALTCVHRTPTMVATPAVSPATPTGALASFDVAITNNDTPSCDPQDFFFDSFGPVPGITTDPSFMQIDQIAAGQTRHLTVTATASDDVDSGTYTLELFAFSNFGFGSAFTTVDFVVVATGCRVSTPRELMITNLGVVDDMRTLDDGPWSFKHLMENIAPSAAAAPDMVEQMLSTFGTTETINGFMVGPRPGMQDLILADWPRTPDGKLDLSQPPLQLQAIVNRFDLRNLDNHDAGEGRFVFAFQFPFAFGNPLQATMIFEYKLPANTPEDIQGWANAWHNLGALTVGTPEYNAALQAITDRFTARGARPGHPNDSAISQVRTNEIDFGNNGIWQLREFNLSGTPATLMPATIKLTPDLGFNNTSTLTDFINANEASIIAETHTVPEQFAGAPFLGGAVFNDFGTAWRAPCVNSNEARHHFAVNTCNGCHSIETGTFFLQISPRFPGTEAFLSGFLTGITVNDPVTGQLRTFNDLGRRRADLKARVCPPDPMTPPPGPMSGGMSGGTGGTGGRAVPAPAASAFQIGTLTKGISRVH